MPLTATFPITVRKARPDELPLVYDRLLTLAFPYDELITRDEFIGSDEYLVCVIPGEDGIPVAASVLKWREDLRLALLAYLVVAQGMRGQGLGSRLLGKSIDVWRSEFPSLGAVLVEIEHPEFHLGSDDHGFPMPRLHFYYEQAVVALAVPYFMATLHADALPVANMILGLVLVDEPAWNRNRKFQAGPAVAEFLVEREQLPPGPLEDARRRLWDALHDPEGVPGFSLSRYPSLPVSGLLA